MSDSEPLISIVVPVYNVEKYLKECLDSICSQTYNNFELILVNDGSTDNSYEICKTFVEKDSRIKVIQQKNSGLVVACKNGIKLSKGEYVCFVDSDDAIEENYLESLVKAQRKYNTEIVLAQIYRYRNNKKFPFKITALSGYYSKKKYDEEILSKILSNGNFQSRLLPPSRWGKLIAKKLILNNLKYYDDRVTYGEDLNLMFPIFLDVKSIYILPNMNDCHYLYRVREGSMINGYDSNRWKSVKIVYKHLYQAINDKNITQDIKLFTQLEMDYFSAVVQCCTNLVKKTNITFKEYENLIYDIRRNFDKWKSRNKQINFGFIKNKILSMAYYGNKFDIYNYYVILKVMYRLKLKVTRKKD